MRFALVAPVWMLVILCCGLPVGWLLVQIFLNLDLVTQVHLDLFYWKLLARSIAYSAAAATIATVLALPVAAVMGRRRGWLPTMIWIMLPAILLIPSVVYSYGWSQLLRLVGIRLQPASGLDVVRCIWSLGAWLWPVPAISIGLSLRRLSADIQQYAMIDGALHRITARLLVGPALVGFAGAFVLALQEFAIYEPTGISVIATEVRVVFDTGLFMAGDVLANPHDTSQSARATAAMLTGLPMLLLIVAAAIATWFLTSPEEEDIDTAWPDILDASGMSVFIAIAVVVITTFAPIVALLLSLSIFRGAGLIWESFSPSLIGSLMVGAATGAIAIALAACLCIARAHGVLALASLSFLVGGQLLAIALIRIYNRPWLSTIYDGPIITIMAYLARFGWIAIFIGYTTWSRPWRTLREMAATDGAHALGIARWVIMPLAWPLILAGGMLVMVFSIGEVPATALLAPISPPMIVPNLLTWVHTLRYDPMIEASLLMVGLAIVAGLGTGALVWIGLRKSRGRSTDQRVRPESLTRRASLSLVICVICASSAGCDPTPEPDAIWLTTGTGPGQVVYPRAISYSQSDDTFVVIDRMARVQRFDSNGRFLNDWRMPEWAIGKPVGVSVSAKGEIYIPDTHYHRVQVYAPDGKLLRGWGSEGTKPGEFIYPTDIALDEKGNVFVSEYGDNDRIQVFSSDGKFLYQFGMFGDGDGQFSRPQSMVIDNGLVYITDSCNHRLVVFTTDGKFVRAMGGPGSGLGEFRFPYGLDIDSRGRLVVCEFGNNRIQLIDKATGRGISTWGVAGHEPGELAYPWAVAVDRKGNVVVVDSGNNRLQVFEF